MLLSFRVVRIGWIQLWTITYSWMCGVIAVATIGAMAPINARVLMAFTMSSLTIVFISQPGQLLTRLNHCLLTNMMFLDGAWSRMEMAGYRALHNFLTRLSILTSVYDIYLFEHKFCLSKNTEMIKIIY